MISLYYTGADSYLGYQPIPYNSLGGYISGSLVPNGRINNLFSDESYSDNKLGSTKLIALGVKTDANVVGLILSTNFDPATANYTLQVAAVTLISPDFQKIEQINDPSDLPYVGNFANFDKNNPVNLGDFNAGTIIGLWIKRTITAAQAQTCDSISSSGINQSPVVNSLQLNFTF